MNIVIDPQFVAVAILLLFFGFAAACFFVGWAFEAARNRDRANETIDAILTLDPTITELAPLGQWWGEQRNIDEPELRRLASIKLRGDSVVKDREDVEAAFERLTSARKAAKKVSR